MKKQKVCEKQKIYIYMQQDWLGYCPTVSQYNGKLYCDTASLGVQWVVVSVSQYNHCIVT